MEIKRPKKDIKRPKNGYMARRVLAYTPGETPVEHAVWDLLLAVQEIYPKKFAQLASVHEKWFNDAHRERAARAWTKEHKLACEHVDRVAVEIACGATEPALTMRMTILAGDNREIDEPPTAPQVLPFDETKDDYLERARRHFREVISWYEARGVTRRIEKHNLDHCRYLAAYLIGGHTWRDLAEGRVQAVRAVAASRSNKTVAGECRKLAQMIGLPLPGRPGPRPGSKRRLPVR